MGTDARHFEVCVVGAGPSGSVAAILLARAGKQVALVRDQSAPTKSHCELISYGAEQQLRFLDLAEALEHSWLGDASRKTLLWETSEPICLESTGALVDRTLFDHRLRMLARQSGVEVFDTPYKFSAAPRGALAWRISSKQDPSFILTTDFLIDATGQGSRFSGSQQRVGLPLFAITARAKGGPVPHNQMFVEALETWWMWLATTSDGSIFASIFGDPRTKEMSDPAEQFHQTLKQSMLVGSRLRGVTFDRHTALNASSYVHSQPAGPSRVVVGDACFSRDPLLSHGLHWAIGSAVSGAAVANTILSLPERTKLAIEYHRKRQREAMVSAAKACASFYYEGNERQSSMFWRMRSQGKTKQTSPYGAQAARKIAGPLVKFCRKTRFEPEPVLRNGMIEEIAALCHPSLERPIAFVENIAIGELFAIDPTPFDCRQLTERVAIKLGHERADQLINYLIQNEAIVPAPMSNHP